MHIKSYAKINLALDAGEPMPNGMHPVDMVMQQISLHDDVTISVRAEGEAKGGETTNAEGAQMQGGETTNAIAIGNGFSIWLRTNSEIIPVDEGNIAFRAAESMVQKYMGIFPERAAADDKKRVCIFIEKRIPVAAGLAGGSGNAAAVIHALNAIWELGLSLDELCDIGKKLGSDVPFCITGQARANFLLPNEIKGDRRAATCARARGTGTELQPINPPLNAHIIIAKPNIGVSTAEVYKGIDSCDIKKRPDIDLVEKEIIRGMVSRAAVEMVNVLENYTLNAYPEVKELKAFMQENMEGAEHVLMSGSGPSVFAIFTDELAAIKAFQQLGEVDCESFLCRTI